MKNFKFSLITKLYVSTTYLTETFFLNLQIFVDLQAGRRGGRADEEDEEAAVEARAVDAHQAREDGGEAAVLQEHPAASLQAGIEPINLHQQLLIKRKKRF